ncbi:branched-chain amino acid ABC transporter permease [Variovorax sp. VNK109]|uniref:branched-chain amino acid ABC transporter permease n=1 Tax=Variovorax sp. VNK109 TaxID=3400919 RepID=UPI003C11B2E6
MRYVFKKRYEQDFGLTRHGGDVFWYGLLIAFAVLLPWVLSDYYIGELSMLMIWSIGGLGAMLLVGYTGQVSLGQAAFIGIGAYTEAVLVSHGVSPLVALPAAAFAAGLVGLLIGLPLTRLHGIYLAIGTLAFAAIAEQVFAHWESLTGGHRGLPVPSLVFGGFSFDAARPFYYLCLLLIGIPTVLVLNWMRSPTGRALVALRDSEVAARSMGVNLVYYKSVAFCASAVLSGLMGALLAHKISYLSPEVFSPLLSIQMLMLVVVGGLGSIHGVFFGAIFIVILPLLIAAAKTYMPESIAQQPAIEPGLYGLILVAFIVFEPTGIYGRWQKVKFFFATFPLYKAASFKRQKTYMRSERLR